MGKLERKVLQQGFCSITEYQKLKGLTWYDKLVLWLKKQIAGRRCKGSIARSRQ